MEEWTQAKEWVAGARVILGAVWDEPVTDAQIADYATVNLRRSRAAKVLEILKENS